jgi:hypothetical protein
MTKIEIADLTREERDEMLMRFLASESAAKTDAKNQPGPASELGQQVLELVTNHLNDDIDHGCVAGEIQSAAYSLECSIADFVFEAIEDAIDDFIQMVNEEVFDTYISRLDTHDEWILRRSEARKLNIPLWERLGKFMSEFTRSKAMHDFRERLLQEVLKAAQDSIVLRADTNWIERTLHAVLEDHLNREFLPAYAQAICDHEYSTVDGRIPACAKTFMPPRP